MSCSQKVRHSKIVFEDGKGKCKMCFDNPNRRVVTKILVDNCAITEGKRCDFLLLDHNSIEYFIELKGKQVAYACSQVEETIKKLTKDVLAIKYSFIVSTACPLTTTEVQIFKATFKKKYNCSLIVKNNICHYCIN